MLTKGEMATLVRLLGVLQQHLQSAVETLTIGGKFDGETEEGNLEDARSVAEDRCDWLAAEELVIKLEKERKKRASV